MCFWFLVWLQVIFNEIYQRIIELEMNIDRKCQDYVYITRVLKYYVENKAQLETWK